MIVFHVKHYYFVYALFLIRICYRLGAMFHVKLF